MPAKYTGLIVTPRCLHDRGHKISEERGVHATQPFLGGKTLTNPFMCGRRFSGLDARFLDALCSRDVEAICGIEQDLLQSGSSELRNWIVAAGVLFDTSLSGGAVDYVPCYRSDAGTGTANGFVCWN